MAQEQVAAADADWRQHSPLELTPILAAALDAFYEHGFHGTTVRDIARRVGMTVPSLYYHHDSKEGVFLALLELSTSELAWRVKAAAAAGTDPKQQFVNVVETIVLHMTHRTRLAALDPEFRHLSSENRKRYAVDRKEIESLLTDIVDEGVRQRIFTATDPAETVRALLGMCQSIARWYQPEGPLKPQDVAARYVDIALATVGAQRTVHRRGTRARKTAVAQDNEIRPSQRKPRQRSSAASK
jgi:AcrR family transcriptional regulator